MPLSAGSRWWRAEPVATDPGSPEHASGVPFWALMAFTFVMLLAPQNLLPSLAPLRIALVTAVLAVATHLVDRFVRRQPLTIVTPELWITAGIVGWALVTIPVSYWPGGSALFLLDFYLKTLVIFWLLLNTVTTLTRLRQVAWTLSLLSIPLATSAVSNYLAGAFVAGGAVKRIAGYDAPLTENPNDLALMLNLILPLTVALFLASGRLIVRVVLLGIIGLQVTAVIVTFSRAGFLTLAATSIAYIWKLWRRPQRGPALMIVSVALLCLPLLPSTYWERLATIADVESDPTGSAQARWNDTVAAASFIVRNPIVGAGLGANVLALNAERGPAWKAVHNVYLEYAVELGLPGLVLFLSLLLSCIRAAQLVQQRSARRPAAGGLFHLAEGIHISLVAFALAAFFHPVGYHFYFYYVAGLALALKAAGRVDAEHPAPERSRASGPTRVGRRGFEACHAAK